MSQSAKPITRKTASFLRDESIRFARDLVRIRSYSGDEKKCAERVAQEMKKLKYDDVWRDRAGNIIGVIKNKGGGGKNIFFNAHTDTVSADEKANWKYPPFEGVIKNGRLWGLGASDDKGAIVQQVYAGALLKRSKIKLHSDIYICAVVMEEVGGLGTDFLVKSEKIDCAVIGESTGGNISLGHRGRIEFEIAFFGKSCHASTPERGANPLYSASAFINKIQKLKFPAESPLGASTVVPAKISSLPASANVVPSEVRFALDYRNVPKDKKEKILRVLKKLASESLADGVSFEIKIPDRILRSFTGYEKKFLNIRKPYLMSAEHPLVKASLSAIRKINKNSKLIFWKFATDGGFTYEAGIPTVGYGEGDETLAHTTRDSIALKEIERGIAGNAALATAIDENFFRE